MWIGSNIAKWNQYCRTNQRAGSTRVEKSLSKGCFRDKKIKKVTILMEILEKSWWKRVAFSTTSIPDLRSPKSRQIGINAWNSPYCVWRTSWHTPSVNQWSEFSQILSNLGRLSKRPWKISHWCHKHWLSKPRQSSGKRRKPRVLVTSHTLVRRESNQRLQISYIASEL